MAGDNGFYVLMKTPPRKDGVPLYWTGVGWHSNIDEAALFRHAGFAAEYARKRGWKLTSDHPYDPRAHLLAVPVFPQIPCPKIGFIR